DSALQWMASPSEYVIRNERAVNTEGSEFSISVVGDIAYYVGEPPVEEADRQDIYGWTGRPYLKIHRAEITEDMGQTAVFIFLPMVMWEWAAWTSFGVPAVAKAGQQQSIWVVR